MSDVPSFESALTGGHPNSLGNTLDVVAAVLADPDRLDDLYRCYFSADPIVRLRTSSAMKRVCIEHPDWLVPYLDGLLTEIAAIDQASTQWTLAILFRLLNDRMTPAQRAAAVEVVQRNLDHSDDWIVQNTSIETLGGWARKDATLRAWLLPRLEQFARTGRKSVASRASTMLVSLAG